MELSRKEEIVALAALTEYMESIERKLNSVEIDEDTQSELANDATLVEILIARLEESIGKN